MSAEARRLVLATPADNTIAELAELVSRTVRVAWTAELIAAAQEAPVRFAELEGGTRPVRVLRRDQARVLRQLDGSVCIHERVLAIVSGEDSPRWIAAERLLQVAV